MFPCCVSFNLACILSKGRRVLLRIKPIKFIVAKILQLASFPTYLQLVQLETGVGVQQHCLRLRRLHGGSGSAHPEVRKKVCTGQFSLY